MDIQKLKALALAATPGPWEHSAPRPGTIFGFEVTAGSGDLVCQGSHHPSYRKEAAANTAFIAAANPAAVLELIAQRDALLALAQSFEITGPDDDGCVWLSFNGKNYTGRGAVCVGASTMVVAQVAKLLEFDRQSAVALATRGALTAPEPACPSSLSEADIAEVDKALDEIIATGWGDEPPTNASYLARLLGMLGVRK